jgi:hypothetical protein
MHIILIHKFSHTAPNMGQTTGQLRVAVTALVKQRGMRITVWTRMRHIRTPYA